MLGKSEQLRFFFDDMFLQQIRKGFLSNDATSRRLAPRWSRLHTILVVVFLYQILIFRILGNEDSQLVTAKPAVLMNFDVLWGLKGLALSMRAQCGLEGH
jgi:hypothetical protein